jgi:hypothetical protein
MKTIHTDRVHLYRPSSWGVCPWRIRVERLSPTSASPGLWIHVDAGRLFRFWLRIAA